VCLPISPPGLLVLPAVRRCEGVTVRAKQGQVFQSIVRAVPVLVLQFQRDRPSPPFPQSTLVALVFKKAQLEEAVLEPVRASLIGGVLDQDLVERYFRVPRALLAF